MSTLPNVAFHILNDASQQRSLRYVCQLVEQAYERQETVYIHTRDAEQAERVNALLWTYRDDSFLPHQLVPAGGVSETSIQIGFQTIPDNRTDVLVNLTDHIPTHLPMCLRIIEIVFADKNVQQLARDRYRQYRAQGCHIETLNPTLVTQ